MNLPPRDNIRTLGEMAPTKPEPEPVTQSRNRRTREQKQVLIDEYDAIDSDDQRREWLHAKGIGAHQIPRWREALLTPPKKRGRPKGGGASGNAVENKPAKSSTATATQLSRVAYLEKENAQMRHTMNTLLELFDIQRNAGTLIARELTQWRER